MSERWIAPSKVSAWEGSPVEGSHYTRQQLEAMKRERPHWTRFSDRSVTLTAQPRDAWDTTHSEHVVVMCPIIAWTKDKSRVLIIAPAGDKIWLPAKKSPPPNARKRRTP